MTLMKSKRPSVDHCCLTLAPSCSISLLTSRMRDGLFLTVWTPSGVRVVSMMYVGMRGSLSCTHADPRAAAGAAGGGQAVDADGRPPARNAADPHGAGLGRRAQQDDPARQRDADHVLRRAGDRLEAHGQRGA